MKHPGGRPTKYRKEYCEMIIEYFTVDFEKTHTKTITTKTGAVIEEEVPNVPLFPTLAGFCRQIQCSKENIAEWAHKHREFSRAVALVKAMGEEILVRYALTGDYDSNFARFVAINYTDMVDKSNLDVRLPDLPSYSESEKAMLKELAVLRARRELDALRDEPKAITNKAQPEEPAR